MGPAESLEVSPISVIREESEKADFMDDGVEEPKVCANATVT